MKFREYINEARVGQTILKQIKAIDKWALDSWGAKKFVSSKDGIQFDVRGPKFRGRVVITLDKLSDTYAVDFGNVRKLEWVSKKLLQNVFAEDLVNVLDQQIG